MEEIGERERERERKWKKPTFFFLRRERSSSGGCGERKSGRLRGERKSGREKIREKVWEREKKKLLGIIKYHKVSSKVYNIRYHKII